ncbi:MAG TPA: metallophosphoesterase, partial [bacterium]|nr:metallophosphoesterase [bacterium]
MKKALLALFLIIASLAPAQERDLAQEVDDRFNFLIANDLGRNGYYDQKPVAAKMGEVGEKVDVEFVALLGDAHHFNGVASVQDPLWMTNYELIYNHPELMCEWYPVIGNHEYRGNTQAVLDYRKVSRRWAM